MEFKNTKYMLMLGETESEWIECTLNGEPISVRISETEGESPLYDEMMKQVDAGELIIEPADEN